MSSFSKKTDYQLGGLGLTSANTPEEIIGASMQKGDPGGCMGGWHLSTMAVMIAASIENASLNYRIGQLCDVITMQMYGATTKPPGQPSNEEILVMLENIKAGVDHQPATKPVETDIEQTVSPTAARLSLVNEPTIEPDGENAEREYQAQLRRVQAIADRTLGWGVLIRFVFPDKRRVAQSATELRPGELALVEEWIEKHAATAGTEYDEEAEKRFDA